MAGRCADTYQMMAEAATAAGLEVVVPAPAIAVGVGRSTGQLWADVDDLLWWLRCTGRHLAAVELAVFLDRQAADA